MRVGLFKSTCARNGFKIMDLFYEGIARSGDKPVFLDDLSPDVDVSVIWSVLFTNEERKKIYEFYNKLKKKIIVLEVGGIMRNFTWRIGVNNINGEGKFPFLKNKSRWNLFNKKIKEYSLSGNKILICGQNEFSMNWPKNLTTESWVKKIIFELKKYTDKKIVFSYHPRFFVKFKEKLDCEIVFPRFKGNYDEYNLEDMLDDCCLLINHNSNSAMEAVFNGINVFVDRTSLCYDVSIKSLSNINNLKEVDRTEWLEKISYTEWFEDEIREGIPYLLLKEQKII